MPKFSDMQATIWRYAKRPGPSTLNTDLVVGWPLEEIGTGDRFDYGDNVYDLTNNAGAGNYAGEIGTFLVESSHQFLSIASADGPLLWPTSTEHMSASASFKVFEWPTADTVNLPVIGIWNANANRAGWQLYPIAALASPARGIIVHATDDGVSNNAVRIDGPVAELDTWYHCLFRYDGSNLKLFVNGTDYTDVPHTTGIYRHSSEDFTVGRYIPPNGISIYADILIKNVNIWSRALSDAEVTEWYNGGEPLSIPFIS